MEGRSLEIVFQIGKIPGEGRQSQVSSHFHFSKETLYMISKRTLEKCFIWNSSSSSRLAKLSWNIFQDLKRRGEGHSRYLSIRCNPFLLTQVVTDQVKLIKLQHIMFEQCIVHQPYCMGKLCHNVHFNHEPESTHHPTTVSNCGTSNGGRGCFPVGTELT